MLLIYNLKNTITIQEIKHILAPIYDFRRAMDPVSSETHFIGAALSLVTLIIMVI